MIKRYVLLLMLLCVCVGMGAMDIVPQKTTITLRARSAEGVVSDESISFDADMLPLMPQLQMLWDLKADKTDFNLLIADEYVLDTIQFVLDTLQLYNASQASRVESINQKMKELGTFEEWFEVIQCADYLELDQDFLDILNGILKEKIAHFLKNKLVQKGTSRKKVLLTKEARESYNLVAFSPDGRGIAAAGKESGIVFVKSKNIDWNSTNNKDSIFRTCQYRYRSAQYTYPNRVAFLEFFENNMLSVTYTNRLLSDVIAIYPINYDKIELEPSVNLRSKEFYNVYFSNVLAIKKISNGLFFCGKGKKEDKNILFYGECQIHVGEYAVLREKFDTGGEVIAAAMNSAGRWIASISSNVIKPLLLWNTINDSPFTYNTSYHLRSGLKNVHVVAFSPDGRFLIAGGEQGSGEGNAALFDVNAVPRYEPNYLYPFKTFGDSSIVNSVAFSSDGKWIISGHSGVKNNIKIWDVETGELITSFAGPSNRVNSVSLSQDGTQLFAGGDLVRVGDESLILWRILTPEEINGLGKIQQCDMNQLGLLSHLCSALFIGNRTDLLADSYMDLFNKLNPDLQNILKDVMTGPVLEGEPEIITLKPAKNLPLTQPAVTTTEPEPEGWTWRQRAAIALGVGAAAAVAIIKGPEAINKAYDWYQKWNKMKR
jgi:WD40 repeat protein